MPDAPNVTDIPSNCGRLREVPLGSVWLLTHHRLFALNNPKRNMPCLSKVSRMVALLSRFWQHLWQLQKSAFSKVVFEEAGEAVGWCTLWNCQAWVPWKSAGSGSRSILLYFSFVDPKRPRVLVPQPVQYDDTMRKNKGGLGPFKMAAVKVGMFAHLNRLLSFDPHETSNLLRYAFGWEMFWPSFLYIISITFARSLEFLWDLFSNTFLKSASTNY